MNCFWIRSRFPAVIYIAHNISKIIDTLQLGTDSLLVRKAGWSLHHFRYNLLSRKKLHLPFTIVIETSTTVYAAHL